MSTLSEILGALVAEVTRARMAADLETVRLARLYESDELLRHLTVPRFRLPEVSLDVPVLFQEFRPNSRPSQALSALPDSELKALKEAVLAEVAPLAQSYRADTRALEAVVTKAVDALRNDAASATTAERTYEMLYHPISDWFASPAVSRSSTAVRSFRSKLANRLPRIIAASVGHAPAGAEGLPASIEASVETAKVLGASDPTMVARVRLKVVESGLECATVADTDGTAQRKLLQE